MEEDGRGGKRHWKIEDYQIQYMIKRIESDSLIKFKKIKLNLRIYFKLSIYKNVFFHLYFQFYTVKEVIREDYPENLEGNK